MTLYIMSGFTKHEALMKKLGKYKMGKSCLYTKKIEAKKRERNLFVLQSEKSG